MDVHQAGWGWGTKFLDYDLDGDLDLYVVTGFRNNSEPNFLFENLLDQGKNVYQDISDQSATNTRKEGRTLETMDYDNDGDLDMLLGNWGAPPYIYRNLTISKPDDESKNWLKIRLEGTHSNRSGFGAIVRITSNGLSQCRLHHGITF